MNTPALEKKPLIIAAAVALIILSTLFLKTFFHAQTIVVFCDVGQGDGAYVRVHNKVDIVVDAGANTNVVECLGKHMPFYDRTIEFAILTHPQADHMNGFLPILQRYRIQYFFTTTIHSKSKTYQELLTQLEEKKTHIIHPNSKTAVHADFAVLDFYWPSTNFINRLNASKNIIDPNDASIIFVLRDSMHSILFTGDASPVILNKLLNQSAIKSTILKVPHHGSRNGLTREFLNLADPAVAVISLGKKNRYGHPSPEIIQMLNEKKILIRRTDQHGTVVLRFNQHDPMISIQDDN